MKKSKPTIKGLKMNNKCFNFLYETFGGGFFDWNHLFNEMEDFELKPSEIIEHTKEWTSEPKFNDFMYACLYLGSEKMKNVLIDYVKDNCEDQEKIIEAIQDYEVEIYADYLDYGFDDNVFNQFTYQELEDKNKQKEMLEMLLDEIGIEYDCESD